MNHPHRAKRRTVLEFEGETLEFPSVDLPTFIELAENQLRYAGPRDKVINIKITVATARMMVEAEKRQAAPNKEHQP